MSEQVQMKWPVYRLRPTVRACVCWPPVTWLGRSGWRNGMGSLAMGMQRFAQAILSAQLLVLPWYEGIEQDMEQPTCTP